MGLLDEIEVACFDLFNTLVRIDTQRLPSVEWEGTAVPSTIPVLHDRIFAPRDIGLDALLHAMRSMWKEVRAELRVAEDREDERWREVPAVEKYRRMLQFLEAIEEQEVEELAEEVAQTHHQTLVSAAVVMEGTEAVLTQVRERGISTVLVSNWDHARAGDIMLEQTNLRPLLDHVVISEAVGFRKPHPKIFEEALAPFEAAPAAALHVGDLAQEDAWGAGRLGFKTVWIDLEEEGWPEGLAPEPSLRITRLRDLLEQF